MAGADGEQFNDVLKKWKGCIYPELKIEDIKRLKNYKNEFESLKNVKYDIVGIG